MSSRNKGRGTGHYAGQINSNYSTFVSGLLLRPHLRKFLSYSISSLLFFLSSMSKSSKRRQRRRILPAGTIVFRGCSFITVSTVTGTASTLSIQPNVLDNPNLSSLSDTFQLYRYHKLKVSVVNDLSLPVAVGYQNNLSDGLPTTAQQLMFLPYSMYVGNLTTVPLHFSVPRRFLLGENDAKYWRTRVSTAGTPTTDLWEDTQGTLTLFGPSNTVHLVVRYTVEFTNAMTPSQTPSPRLSLIRGDNKKRLVMDAYLVGSPCSFPSDVDLKSELERIKSLTSPDPQKSDLLLLRSFP